jgi:hypothetical protein
MASFLLHFLEGQPRDIRDKLRHEVLSLQAALKVIRCWKQGKLGHPDKAKFHAALQSHAIAYRQAYYEEFGDSIYKPKFHYTRHLPGQHDRDGFGLDCWTGERYHQLMKVDAENLDNTDEYEEVLLRRVIVSVLGSMELLVDKLGKSQQSSELGALLGGASCSVSRTMQFSGSTYNVGQVLIADGRPIEVAACVLLDDCDFVLLVWPCIHVRKVTSISGLWRKMGTELSYVKLGDVELLQPVLWSRESATDLLVVFQ